MLIITVIFIPMMGMAGMLFSHELIYIIPTVLGTFGVILVAHSPIFSYIESLQKILHDKYH